MSGFSMTGRLAPVNQETPTRRQGRRPRPDLGAWTYADLIAHWRGKSAGELARTAEAFADAPPAMRLDLYLPLAALAAEACTRVLAVTVVDGEGVGDAA